MLLAGILGGKCMYVPISDSTHGWGQPPEREGPSTIQGQSFRGAHTITLGRKPSGNLAYKLLGEKVKKQSDLFFTDELVLTASPHMCRST